MSKNSKEYSPELLLRFEVGRTKSFLTFLEDQLQQIKDASPSFERKKAAIRLQDAVVWLKVDLKRRQTES